MDAGAAAGTLIGTVRAADPHMHRYLGPPTASTLAYYDVWTTEESVESHFEVRDPASHDAAADTFLRRLREALKGEGPGGEPVPRPPDLVQRVVIVRLTLEPGVRSGPGYGARSASGTLLRYTLRDLAYLAVVDLDARRRSDG